MSLSHSSTKKIDAGRFYPLGATLDMNGVNFAVYSKHADEAFLLLFDTADGKPTDIIAMRERTRHVFHVYVHGIKSGQLYGYKIKGRFDPARGYRFNENKLLIDPYAKALTGKASNRDNLLLSYDPLSGDMSFDERDSSPVVPKSIVIDDSFSWDKDVRPDIATEKLIIYEVHVKGFTAAPTSGVSSPGTYLGFIEKIPYLKNLGINAIELLPCHEYYIEDFIASKGLTNYWGYNTLAYFSPEIGYSSRSAPGSQVNEFKTMVKELHRAGIEVIMDVVYNHTAEGNECGPTLSFKGIDNPSYYVLTGPSETPYRYYMNYSGCGNSFNLANPAAMRLVMDSLRYWTEIMHVDGFRFDLASVLGREGDSFRACASFFDALSQDPVLSRIKLIAEPWDLSTYQIGNFPIDWMEWNGRYRDVVRRFIKGDPWQIQELGYRLTGSSDLFADDGRSAFASINFITCHDGFTLNDLVSYNGKHNDANHEDNRDGSNDNFSWNCGVEGPTDNSVVINLRRQMVKNHLCMLLLSAGTPMILGGDEHLRTQNGNNNAYCQDNPISWFDWSLAKKNADILAFTKKLIAFRMRFTVFQRSRFFNGRDNDLNGIPDIKWFSESGNPVDWNSDGRTLCFLIDAGENDTSHRNCSIFIIHNADYTSKETILPSLADKRNWKRAIDTSMPPGEDILDPGKEPVVLTPLYHTNSRSSVVLISEYS
jgi:isoamylase